MTNINISDELFSRLTAFGAVVQAVSGELMNNDCVAELVIDYGMDLMLSELLGNVDSCSLLTTIQKLGRRHPAEVYAFIADVWKAGTDVERKEETRKRIGFHLLQDTARET